MVVHGFLDLSPLYLLKRHLTESRSIFDYGLAGPWIPVSTF